MRILKGQFKGKYLSAGQDLSIRPTTNRIKEIIFSIIGDYIAGKWVIDLFCGSGSLGCEAISRGAKGVTFVDESISSINILKLNIQELCIDSAKFKIVNSDVIDFIRNSDTSCSFILADPPFRYPQIQKLVNDIFQFEVLAHKGVLMLHHEISNPIQKESENYELIKQKKVGRSLISFIGQESENV